MQRILAAVLFCLTTSTSAYAAYTPIYLGLKLDNVAASGFLGYQINKTYAVEAHYTKSETHINQSGVTSDTNITSSGLAALFMVPMKLTGGSPYFIFAKVGYERINKDDVTTIPASVTLTTPFNSTTNTNENRVLWGGGVQYDFYENVNGRAGIDFTGDKRSVYIAAIFKF